MSGPSPRVMARRQALLLAALLAAVFLVAGACLLSDYGPTWDCAIGEYPHGEQYLAFFLSGDAAYLDFPPPAKRAGFREPHLDYRSVDWLAPAVTYPFAAELSALSCRVLWTGLGLVPPLQAHNLVVLLFAAALLFVIVVFTARCCGAVAALGAGLALCLSPRFFADSFNNLKDIPETTLYVGAMLAAFAGLRERRLRSWALFGVLTGLALAQKPNALFLPVHVVLLWLGLNGLRLLRHQPLIGVPWKGLLLALPIFAAVYLLVSPGLWPDPGRRFLDHLVFVMEVGRNAARTDALDGVKHVLWTTPPGILLLALLGVSSRRLDGDLRFFLALGVAVPVGRTVLPSMANFDGVRHFIEFHAFLAVLAGIGLAAVAGEAASLLRLDQLRRGARRATAAVVTLAFFLSPAIATATTHPYGLCYFNRFLGGLKGAQAIDLHEATDYWCHSYWHGLTWISDHGPDGSAILVPVAEHVARVAAPLRLRPGITMLDRYDPPEPTALFVMFTTRTSHYDDLVRSLLAEDAPVHEVLVQGAPILKIYRIDDRERAGRVIADWVERRAFARLGLWFNDHRLAEGVKILRNARQLGQAETLRLLAPLIAPEVERDLEPAVRYGVRRVPGRGGEPAG